MADTQLDILIRLLADTQGANAVQNSLNKLKDSTGEASEAGKALNDTTEEGAKKAEESEISHHALHQILHLIGRESGPEAEAALAAIGAAGLGSLSIAILAAQGTAEAMGKIVEKVKELREEAADVQSAVFEAQRQSMSDLAQAAADYEATLRRIKSVGDEIKKNDDERMAVIKASVDAAQKLLEYQEKQALIAANGNKEEEDRVKQIFEGRKETTASAGEVAKIVQTRNTLEELVTNAAAAKTRMDQAHAATTAATANSEEAARAQAEMDALKNRKGAGENDLLSALFAATGLGKGATLDAARQEIERLKKEAATASDQPTIGEEPGTPTLKQALQGRVEEAQKALDAVDKMEGKLNELNKVVVDHNIALDNLKKAEERASDEWKKLNDQADATRAALKQAEEIYKISADESRAEGKTAPSIPAVPSRNNSVAPSAEEAMQRIQQTEDALYAILNAGGQLDKTQAATLQQILQMQTGHRVAQTKMLQVVRSIYEDAKAFQAAMDRELNAIQHARDQAGY